ncbi:hypothetical protein, partial [Xenorhabdus griffiniae]
HRKKRWHYLLLKKGTSITSLQTGGTGLGRGSDGRYGRHDESGRGAGQAVSGHVRANDDAETVVQRKVVK